MVEVMVVVMVVRLGSALFASAGAAGRRGQVLNVASRLGQFVDRIGPLSLLLLVGRLTGRER